MSQCEIHKTPNRAVPPSPLPLYVATHAQRGGREMDWRGGCVWPALHETAPSWRRLQVESPKDSTQMGRDSGRFCPSKWRGRDGLHVMRERWAHSVRGVESLKDPTEPPKDSTRLGRIFGRFYRTSKKILPTWVESQEGSVHLSRREGGGLYVNHKRVTCQPRRKCVNLVVGKGGVRVTATPGPPPNKLYLAAQSCTWAHATTV